MYISIPRTFYRIVCVLFILLVSVSLTGCDDSQVITSTTKIDSLEWKAVAKIQEWKTCDENGWVIPEGAVVYKEQGEINHSAHVFNYFAACRVSQAHPSR